MSGFRDPMTRSWLLIIYAAALLALAWVTCVLSFLLLKVA
jgi:hypothetical protein